MKILIRNVGALLAAPCNRSAGIPALQQRKGEMILGAKITVKSNGSVRIEGDFEIVDQEGKAFGLGGRTIVSLCRCGHSENKPFCDGSHKRVGFQSEIKAFDLPAPVPKPASA